MVENPNKFSTVANNFLEPKSDVEWINFILCYLIKFYEIHKNIPDFQNKTENQITEAIYFWLIKIKKFNIRNFVVSQPRSNNEEIEGYYDLMFKPRKWMESDPHFAVENKILEDNSESYKEYIYKPIADSQRKYNDGGMYRFLSNKYAQNQAYGGLIAFVKKGNIKNIKSSLLEKIKNLKIPKDDDFYGEIIDSHLLNLQTQNFENSFQSNHKRIDETEIHLIHLLFWFN